MSESAIQKFSPVEAGLQELKSKHLNVVIDVTSTDGLAKAKAGRSELKEIRLQIEKIRKDEKDFYLKAGNAIDAEAKRLTSEVKPMEDSYDLAIKKEEQRKEDEKLAKLKALKEAEEARIREQVEAAEKLKAEERAIEEKRLADEKAALEAEKAAFKKAQDEIEAKAKAIRDAEEMKMQEARKAFEAEQAAFNELKAKEAREEATRKLEIEKAEKALRDAKQAEQDRLDKIAKDERLKVELAERAEREKQEVMAREIMRQKSQKLDAYNMLETFVDRFGDLDEFSTISQQINKFIKSSKQGKAV